MTSSSQSPEVKRIIADAKTLRAMGIPYSGEHLRRMEAAGLFPKRIRLSAGRVAWRIADIEEWLASRPTDAI